MTLIRSAASVVFVAMLAVGCGAPEAVPEPPPEPVPETTAARPQFAVTGEHPCEPVGEIQFICDMVSPEDIAVVPNTEWAIISGAREGGRLHLVNTSAKASVILFPTPERVEDLDATNYASCPGPLDLIEPDVARYHGLYLRAGENDVHTLLVIHHGSRESVEVFKIDAQAQPPNLTWVGCVIAPGEEAFNSVVALPDGGVAATSGGSGVWEWHKDTGWSLIPESEDTAPNGLEVSPDGRFVYIAGWAEEKLTRLSRGRTPVEKDVVALGFRPDNLRMSYDGSVIYAAGHTDKNGNSITDPREPTLETSNVAAIDPDTLDVERIFVHRAMDGFVASTTAIRIRGELWLGSYRGDRAAYLPFPE